MRARPWKGKRDELRSVNAAVDRELDDYTKRDSAMQGRATVLIGAASVVGAVQIGDAATWQLVGVGLSLLAAVAGVVVVFPRGGDAFNPRTLWEEVYAGTSEEEALHHTIRVKLETLDKDDKWLSTRGKFARVGFVLLALSVLATTIGALLPADSGSGHRDHEDPPRSHVQEK